MSQIPPKGAIGRETFINDHLIEDFSVDVSDSETGKFYFGVQHKYMPSVIVVKSMDTNAPHINFYMTEITNIGNFATGSIMLRAGVTGADLDGDSFTLIDKDGTEKVFTFDQNVDTHSNGTIGTLPFNGGTAAEVIAIATRIADAINDIPQLRILSLSASPDPSDPGGAITTLAQEITGSTGNTQIDMSGVTGVDASDFMNGTNYGSGSFAASETFSGKLLIRAASLQIEYL